LLMHMLSSSLAEESLNSIQDFWDKYGDIFPHGNRNASRDPENKQGITIDCEGTNGRLRHVYELHFQEGTDLMSPSGAYYKAKNALDALNKKCPPTQSIMQGPSFLGSGSKEAAVASLQANGVPMLNAPGTVGGSASLQTGSAQSKAIIDTSRNFIMARICAVLLAAFWKCSK